MRKRKRKWKWNHRQARKKKDYKMEFFIALLLMIGILITCFIIKKNQNARVYEYCQEYVMTEELPDLMEFCYYSKDEWQDMIEEEKFGKVVTLGMVKWLTVQTGTAEYVALPQEKDKYIVTRDEFNQVYDQFLDLLDEKREITVADEVVLKQEDNSYTTGTKTYTSNIELPFIETMKSYQFYVKADTIIGARNMQGVSSAVKNVYLLEENAGTIKFLYGGETYEISMEDSELEGVENQVCDLLWETGALSKIQLKKERIEGNLIAVDDSKIRIEGYGEIKRSQNLPVYKTYGTVEEKKLSDIVIANMQVEYVVAEDRVEAILLVEPAQISRIRVLLLGEDAGIYHKEVFLTCNTSFTVSQNDKEEEKEKDTVINAEELFDDKEEGSFRFKPVDEKGELFLCDKKGEKTSLGYLGTLEIEKYKEGYTIISELSIEDYLCGVVPSEMPASYGLEALKSQAVCARSYVYIQLEKGDYAAYGAHVDDSTNYQVYNKQERDETTNNAVWDTAGQVLMYQGNIAEAYYFSTSWGTTDNGDAWELDKEPSYGYLHSIQLKEEQETFDYSNEKVFAKYIQENGDSYDSFSPFYRWEAICNFTDQSVLDQVNAILAARKEKVPDSITYLDKKGKEAESAKGFGKIKKILVNKRSFSGIILELCLVCEKGKIILTNEYNIRAVLGAGCQKLTLNDKSLRDDFSLLPSAYAVVMQEENDDFRIVGGGYGHGIGMSQNGACKMAENGRTYEEILKFFFQDVEISPVS